MFLSLRMHARHWSNPLGRYFFQDQPKTTDRASDPDAPNQGSTNWRHRCDGHCGARPRCRRAAAGPGQTTSQRTEQHQRPGTTGVEGAGGTGGHGRASRRGAERSEALASRAAGPSGARNTSGATSNTAQTDSLQPQERLDRGHFAHGLHQAGTIGRFQAFAPRFGVVDPQVGLVLRARRGGGVPRCSGRGGEPRPRTRTGTGGRRCAGGHRRWRAWGP